MQKEIPLWVVASLGEKVALRKDFVGPCETYLAGCEGVLTSVQCDEAGSGIRVTVALDPQDPSYWETLPLGDIRQVLGQSRFTLDLVKGVLHSPPLDQSIGVQE